MTGHKHGGLIELVMEDIIEGKIEQRHSFISLYRR